MNRFTVWFRNLFIKPQTRECGPSCKWLNITLQQPDADHPDALFSVSAYCNYQGQLKPIGPSNCSGCLNFEAEVEYGEE